MENILKKRVSIRKFQDKDIDNNILIDLLESAFRASTTGNMQLYSVIITKDKSKKEQLAPSHFCQPAFMNAPVILTFCADYNRFNKWCEARKTDPGSDNILSLTSAALDAIIAAQTFCVAAEAKGLGICYLGTTTYNASQIAETLSLPKFVVPIVTLSVGYPDEAPKQTDRLNVGDLVHFETYKDYTNSDIERIYAPKESLPENIAFVKENEKQNLAQVFAEVRYKRADNEAFSKSLISFLRKQGFLHSNPL